MNLAIKVVSRLLLGLFLISKMVFIGQSRTVQLSENGKK